MKRTQNRRYTSSICEHSLGKVLMKRNENFFGVTDYTNLVPLKCCGRTGGRTDGRTDGQTDGRSGPTTRHFYPQADTLRVHLTLTLWVQCFVHLRSNF